MPGTPPPAPFAVASVIGGCAVLVAAAVAALALLARDPRHRAAACVAAPVLGGLALASTLHGHPLTSLRAHAGPAAAAAALGLVAVLALALLFHRRPGVMALAVVAALPFRVPVGIGSSTANLLVPLYLVIAAGCLAHVVALVRGPGAGRPADAPRERWVRALELALAAAVVLYAVQSLYSTDVGQAAKNVAFFYVPFTVLFRLLLDVSWSQRALRACLWLTTGLALLFAAIGFVEFATGRLLLTNSKVLEANELKPYFRVNSLFFDPNIYGRYLALTIVLLAAVLLWSRRPRHAALIGAALAVLWAGLVLSLSQSSFGALLVGLAVLAALRWRAWPVVAAAVAAAAIAAALVFLVPGVLHIEDDSTKALDKATSGRVELIDGAVAMFRDRPVAGFGSGSFQERYRAREHVSSPKAAAVSHTIPLTIAAEQGIAGLLAYVCLLGVVAGMLLAGVRPALRRDPPGAMAVARGALAAATAALVLHTLVYASFLEDPLLWTLLAVAAALRLGGRAEGPPAPPEPAASRVGSTDAVRS